MATFASDFWAKFWEGTDGKVRFCWGFVVDICPPGGSSEKHRLASAKKTGVFWTVPRRITWIFFGDFVACTMVSFFQASKKQIQVKHPPEN